MRARFDESAHARTSDGRFAERPRAAEAHGVQLGTPLGTEPDFGPDSGPGPDAVLLARWACQPDPYVVMHAGPDELAGYVRHPDWEVRLDSLANPNVTSEHLERLADPDAQPVAVRVAAARLAAGPALAARDPNPMVRYIGWSRSGAMAGSRSSPRAGSPAGDRAVAGLAWLLGDG